MLGLEYIPEFIWDKSLSEMFGKHQQKWQFSLFFSPDTKN